MLAKIMKKTDAKLWDEANETGPFGNKAFRRLAVKDYIQSGVNVEEKLRSIGLTLITARRYYEHPNSSSNVRAQELMGAGTSGVRRPARKAPKVQDSDPESDSESDSDEEDSPGLSDDDTPEEAARNRKKKDDEDEEATAKTPKHKGVGKKSKN